MKYSEFYLEQLSNTDLELGEPVYLSDGLFLLPDGSMVEDDSKEYERFYRKYYESKWRKQT